MASVAAVRSARWWGGRQQWEDVMRGKVGDRLILEGTHVGDTRRSGVVIALRRDDGSPPYLVRWLDNGHEGLVFPGPDARIQPPHAPLPEHP